MAGALNGYLTKEDTEMANKYEKLFDLISHQKTS